MSVDEGLSIPEPGGLPDLQAFPSYPADPYDARPDGLDHDGDGETATA